jgi:hypothetical protein
MESSEKAQTGEAAGELLRHLLPAADPDVQSCSPKCFSETISIPGIKVAPPKTTMEKRTRDDLPRDRATVFDLNPGQVSPVIVDPAGYYIYKIDSKSVQPLSEVEQAIRTTLRQQNLERLMGAVTLSAKTELNRKYFGAFEKPLEFGGPEPPEESGDLSPKPEPGPAVNKQPSKARPDSPK